MTCDDARRLLSDRMDEPLVPARQAEVDEHVAGCEACQAYERGLQQVRAALWADPAPAPDLTASIMTAVRKEAASADAGRTRVPRAWLPVAAAFVGALVVGALLVGSADRGGDDVAAADLVARLDEAQRAITALSADVEVVEHGLHPDVPERRFTGSLQYRAPETMVLHLEDGTDYPGDSWPADDVDLVVDEDTWWAGGIRDCPAVAQPACLSPRAEVQEVTEREPFSASAPVPLDLITPVQSFRLSGAPATLPDEQVDGRATVGVEVTAAQVAPLLEGLAPAGNLREVHPTDRVELRLDEGSSVPVALTVRAAEGELREQWALRHGYQDQVGEPVLEVRLSDLRLDDDARSPEVVAPPADARLATRSEGFHDEGTGAAVLPVPDAPLGFELHQRGVVPLGDGGELIGVSSWTDGRAWLTQRTVAGRMGDRLFGELGASVRSVDLGAAGVAYLSEDGRRAGLHAMAADDTPIDVVVTGSVDQQVLLDHLGDLGLVGLPVPAGWAEASTATRQQAVDALPTLLLPAALEGFGPPSFRVDGEPGAPVVRAAYAGPGSRAFVLVQTAGDVLAPPLDTADVVAVEVRGEAGRFSPERGLLEWVDDDTLRSLQSTSIGLGELVALAESLAAPS
jgi:hypothetical protein